MASTNSFLENILTFLMIFTKFVIIPVLFSYIKNTKMANDWQSLGLRAVYGTGFFLFARYLIFIINPIQPIYLGLFVNEAYSIFIT